MPNPLTVADLKRLTCGHCGTDHRHQEEMFFHSNCHMGAPTWTVYKTETETIEVRCSVCNEVVCAVKVAKE